LEATEAAAQLGIDQAKLSKLLAGQMAGFSIERLVHFLSLLGQDVFDQQSSGLNLSATQSRKRAEIDLRLITAV